MIIVFDTETTGLPKVYSAPAEDLENWPRIIQLAYSIYSLDGRKLHSSCQLIKPEGWEVPKSEFWIKNGFTQERSLKEGFPIREVLAEFIKHRLVCQYSVAHNIHFDTKIIRAEMIRQGWRHIDFKSKKICTMSISTKFCNLPQRDGRPGLKFPNLTELHKKLFNIGFDKAHQADADVEACAKCFFELRRLGVFTL